MKSAFVLQVLRPWLGVILATAEMEHVDARTLAAIVFLESRGQPQLVSKEKNGTCSVGLGMVNVADCDPQRMRRLQDPVYNLRVSAQILKTNQNWCRRHPTEWRCRAGERSFRGGGAVNCYAGRTKDYAAKVQAVRRLLPHPDTAVWRRQPHSTKKLSVRRDKG